MARRFPEQFPNGFNISLREDRLDKPKTWRAGKKIFVNSMSDLFHDQVPLEFVQRVFDTMVATPRHTYQILTKRHERLLELAPFLDWVENIWMGVSVESQERVDRIDALREVPAKVRFLSCEPLLGPLELDLTGIHWVIVGGESGAGHRELRREWVESLLAQSQAADIPFFFKQWGGRTSKANGRTLNGREWLQMPEV